MAAGGGALWPAIGKWTRVDLERGGTTAAPHEDWFKGTFQPAYARAHAQALQAEFQFVSEQLSRVTEGRLQLSPAEVAAVDTVNSEAREYLIIDGVTVNEHPRYAEWHERATMPVEQLAHAHGLTSSRRGNEAMLDYFAQLRDRGLLPRRDIFEDPAFYREPA